MMSMERIRNSDINGVVAREAHDQAVNRLCDLLDVKKMHEQKAFTLFGGYTTVSIAPFAVAGVYYKDIGLKSIVLPFIATGSMFVAGAMFFLLALLDKPHGTLGSDPNMWLTEGTIDGDDGALPRMLAYITYHHQNRIEVSKTSNQMAAHYIRSGIWCGVIAPVLLILLFLVPLERLL